MQQQRPLLGTSIIFGDKTMFEIVSDVILSGSPRSPRRIAAPDELKPCPRCQYYGCACGTPEFETWLKEQG